MDTTWNLNNIYPSVDSEEFKRDTEEYKRLLSDMNEWAYKNLHQPDKAALEKYIELKNKLMAYNKLELYLNLAISVDTQNEELNKALDVIESIKAGEAVHEALFSQFIKSMGEYEETPLLKEHRYFIKEQRKKAAHILSPDEEKIISDMKINGSKLWEKQWQSLTSNLVTDYENMTLTNVRNMAYSPDRDVRKAAYESELRAYEKIKTPTAYCLNGIKGEVIKIAEMRKYASPLEMTLEDSRIDRDILNAMFSAIEEGLPELRKYFAAKGKKLGGSEALAFYDIFAPLGKNKEYTVKEAKDLVINSFYGFSEDMGRFAETEFDSRRLDIMPRKGKVGGAYCETIHSIKESRILLNFGGTFDDVVTIAHELGHAFHSTRLFRSSELNSFYPMPIAETASTFCENIITDHMLKSSDHDKIAILEADLQGISQCIVDIYSRFLFEDTVFAERKKGFISADALCSYMENAQKKAYGKGLESYHPFMWVCKPHYYDADFNYYNFPYAFGALLSKGLYSMYKEQGKAFVQRYDELLSISAANDIKDAAKTIGIDLYDKAFWKKGIDMIVEEIDVFDKM